MQCICKTVQLLLLLVNQGLCYLRSVTNTTQNFSDIKFEKKNKNFGLWKTTCHSIFFCRKMFIIEISYNFLYVWLWHCMELYGKKFFIYGNYMIRSFDQPVW